MLRKMYLVSPDYLNKSSSPSPSTLKPKKKKKRVRKTQNVYDKWFRMRNEMREADINRKSLIRSIADLFQKMLPVKSELSTPPPPPPLDTQLLPSTSRNKPDPSPEEEEEEDVGNAEDDYVETEVQDLVINISVRLRART